MTPQEIYESLRRDVIGQDAALHEMAVAIYKHLIEHSAGNVFMIGNSGTGKTTIMRAVERFFSEAEGYERFSTIIRINANLVADLANRGQQSNVVMDRLAHRAAEILGEQADLETLREYVAHGIVCVDEVDKIRSVVGGEPNVKGITAQDSLLTLMENEHVQVEMRYFDAGRWHTQVVPVNTEHVLFVAGGAFEELYDQVLQRVTKHSGIDKFYKQVLGADGTYKRHFVFNLSEHLTLEDIFAYGMTPQFLSRFDSTIMLKDLRPAHLVEIFRDTPDAIWPQAVAYFRNMGIDLTITDEAAFRIADIASGRNRLGARALREVFGKIIKPLEFDPAATGLLQESDGRQVLEITIEVVEAAQAEKA
jgi:ATP-dependent Clp protease ATP-binding subunit ClpX